MPAPKPLHPEPYHIEHPTGTCAVTGKKLEPGDPYIATLVESPTEPTTSPARKEGVPQANSTQSHHKQKQTTTHQSTSQFPLFHRVDLSIDAWEQNHRPDKLFSFWRSIVPEPNTKKKLFVDDEILLDLFARLADTDDPQKRAFRFVLALILMRKKRLKYDGNTTKPGPDDQTEEWWIMKTLPARTRRQSNDSHQPSPSFNDQPAEHELFNPRLNESQIQEVAEQLGQILEVEL